MDQLLAVKEQQLKKYKMVGSYPARDDVTIEDNVFDEEELRHNSVPWFPASYKDYMIKEFVKNVLMK